MNKTMHQIASDLTDTARMFGFEVVSRKTGDTGNPILDTTWFALCTDEEHERMYEWGQP